MAKEQICCIFLILYHITPTLIQAQDESLAEVTLEMFVELEREILGLNSKIADLQDQMAALAKSIENLASDSAVVGSIELAELRELIDVSNRQEGDIQNLLYFNSLWQKNFRNINITFQKLRKGIAIPSLSVPVVSGRPVILLPAIAERSNVITVREGNHTKTYQLSNLKVMKNITVNGPTRLRRISNSTTRITTTTTAAPRQSQRKSSQRGRT